MSLLQNNITSFEGMNAVTSANVSGRPFATKDTGVKAIIGDWNQAQWGVIREMALRRFDVGDPDGRGYGLTTSQYVTAPKRVLDALAVVVGLTTSQYVTAPKQKGHFVDGDGVFDYQSVCHCSKTR